MTHSTWNIKAPHGWIVCRVLWVIGFPTQKTRLCFYQTRSAWSMDQGSNRKHSAVHNYAPTVSKFCVMWEGQALPHDTKFSNCRCEIVGRRVIFIWSLIPGSSWSGLIKAEPVMQETFIPLWHDILKDIIASEAHFTNNFSVAVIQIRWKFQSALIQDIFK